MRQATVDQKIGYAVAASVCLLLLSVFIVPLTYIRLATAAILILAAAGTCLFVKKRSIHSFNKRQVLLIMSVIALVYLILYYVSGISFGFGATYAALNASVIFLRALPVLLSIIAFEVIRSVLLAQNSRLVSVLLFLCGVLCELLLAGGVWGINSMYGLMDFVGLSLFPALTANLLYHYVSKRYGMLPNIAFRIILTLYAYLLPIVPTPPQVLPAFALLLLPLLTYAFIDVLFEKKQRRALKKRGKWFYAVGALVLAVMVAFAMLISCYFRFGIIVVATDSMTGEINRGDAIVYEAYEHCSAARENDVIIFQKKDMNYRTVHRVIEVEPVNGQNRYITKGDANDDPDFGYVTDEDIIGVVRFKVAYIGHPSLWLREIFD